MRKVNRILYREMRDKEATTTAPDAWACCTKADMEIVLEISRLLRVPGRMRDAARALAKKASKAKVLRACIHFMLSILKFHATGLDPGVYKVMGRTKRARSEYRTLLFALADLREARAACGIVLHIE